VASSLDSVERVVANRYRLHERLGSGGMGTVWRGKDVVLGRDVAVKEVAFPVGASAADRAVLRERIRREARAAAQLDHPGAVTVHDVVEDGSATYVVMQYVPAQTLSEVIRRDGPLSPQRTARVGLAVLGALRAAHARGIVHRDVKPSNVLLGLDDEASPDRVFLTDFGIASAPGDSSLTSSGLLIGSPGYIAPERARGDVPGPASDLWSLGATLFTAVEGHPPYDGDDPMATLTAVMVGEHAPYVRAGPLQPVLAELLERDPAKRIMAAQLATALAEVATSAVSRVATVPSPLPAGAINPDASAGTAVLHVGEGSPISQAARPAAAEVPPGQQLAGRTVAPPSRAAQSRAAQSGAAQSRAAQSGAAQSRAAQSRPTRSCRCTRPTPLAEVSAPPHMARVGQPLSRCRPWLGRLPDRPRRRWGAARWSRGRGSRRIDGFVRTVDGLVRPASVTRYCGDADRAAAPDDRRPH